MRMFSIVYERVILHVHFMANMGIKTFHFSV